MKMLVRPQSRGQKGLKKLQNLLDFTKEYGV
jgi:hypothetical protein